MLVKSVHCGNSMVKMQQKGFRSTHRMGNVIRVLQVYPEATYPDFVCEGRWHLWLNASLIQVKKKVDSAQHSLQVSVDTAQSHSPSSSWRSAKTFGEMKGTAKGSLDKHVKHFIC